jgi:membrane fusion protein, multidrug efflux system
MNRRRLFWSLLAASLLVLAALALGFHWGRSRGREAAPEEASGEKETVTATVKVAAMRPGRLEHAVTAFGSIVPAPGASQAVSVSYECRVVSISVSEGQVLAAGTPLLTVTDSPDALLDLVQARIEEKSLNTQLQQARGRFELKLADNAQLAQAEQAFRSAQAKVKSLEARHMGGNQVLRATTPGVVTRIPAQAGAVLAPGSPLVEVTDTRRLESRLGVESLEAASLRSGAALTLSVVDGPRTLSAQARVRIVSPAINPATRLTDVFVSLPPGHPFVLGQYVLGKIQAATREGMIVPYAAVLPDEGHFVLYTVRKGKAVRHEVQILLQAGDRIQVAAQGLDASEPVVVQGNYELQDGMAVRVEQAQ